MITMIKIKAALDQELITITRLMFVTKEKLPTETHETTEKHNTSRYMGKVYEIGYLALEERRTIKTIFPVYARSIRNISLFTRHVRLMTQSQRGRRKRRQSKNDISTSKKTKENCNFVQTALIEFRNNMDNANNKGNIKRMCQKCYCLNIFLTFRDFFIQSTLPQISLPRHFRFVIHYRTPYSTLHSLRY